ncbi:glycosyl transferase [Pedobacter changchengzhani]|uniref:Glycosyl transferase n=1 Tax=Pedobacter changchengzhani TaxID=2529274 RepID=A0A4V3A0J6_9SPHI|nr:glycosyltransferase family 39 protein [Pedobacter changchengzhani]TDG37893.1 glycosyl transferase [Pedobacter changchengzhani]
MQASEKRTYLILIFLLAVFGLPALFTNIIEPDGALYASISKNMVLHHDWLNLYSRGADWLDKPHLPFWLATISFKIFGISSFAYKLPSYLAGLMAARFVFQFAKNIYTEKLAYLSTVIFLSSLHVIVSTFDVRAEIYITAFAFGAIYFFERAGRQEKISWALILGSVFAACAVMVKGIFVLITILGGFVIYWILTKQYKEFSKAKWYLAVLLIFIFITPEIYTLYTQFDMHPEVFAQGQKGVSGVKFFFWDSQFGRFFNTGPIRGKGDPSFFLHTTLWAFLPWSILWYIAVFNLLKKKERSNMTKESIILWASATVTFLIFSLSKFQLPHYILLLFPQFSIMTALYIANKEESTLKTLVILQSVIVVLVTIGLFMLTFYFGLNHAILINTLIISMLLFCFLIFKGISLRTLIGKSVTISLILMVFLYFFFYPAVLKYESGMQAGIWLKQNYPNGKAAVFADGDAFSFDFYAPGEPKYFWTYEELNQYKAKEDLIIYVRESELERLKKDYNAEVLQTFKYFHITKLTPTFINVKTRSQVLENIYLVKLH